MNETGERMKELFPGKRPNFQKLSAYGFEERGGGYTLTREILDGEFILTVFIDRSGAGRTELLDSLTQEPYTLHLVEGVAGEYVGRVKEEYERVLGDVSAHCFEREAFHEPLAKKLIADVRDKSGDELEFLWARLPEAAVWRRKDNQKWYAVLMTVDRKKCGMKGEGKVEILDVRADPRETELLADGERIFPGYHMNKKHWITLPLDGTLPYEELRERLEESRFLAGKR